MEINKLPKSVKMFLGYVEFTELEPEPIVKPEPKPKVKKARKSRKKLPVKVRGKQYKSHAYKGEKLAYWTKITGNTPRRIRSRLAIGWDLEKAIFEPRSTKGVKKKLKV